MPPATGSARPRRGSARHPSWEGLIDLMTKWIFEPGHSAAEFRARHMMVTWVRGHFKNVKGTMALEPDDPGHSSVTVVIDANQLWTGEPARGCPPEERGFP